MGNILDERHEKGREEGLQEGEARGIAKGREEGREEGEARGIAKGREEGLLKGLQKGEARGIAKGRVEGALSSLLKLVEMKFGTIGEADKERLAQLDSDQVTRALSRILTANTLADIF